MARPISVNRYVVLPACLMLAFASTGHGKGAASRKPGASTARPVEVNGPTFIAFAPVVTQDDEDKLTDDAEALDDFLTYFGAADKCLKSAGISTHFVQGSKLVFREKGRLHMWRTSRAGGFGFYLIAPGKKPRILGGVHDTDDLYEAAASYFSISPAVFQRCAGQEPTQ